MSIFFVERYPVILSLLIHKHLDLYLYIKPFFYHFTNPESHSNTFIGSNLKTNFIQFMIQAINPDAFQYKCCLFFVTALVSGKSTVNLIS